MSDNKITKKSSIKVNVGLNKDRLPVHIEWEAKDQPGTEGSRECKAMFLSLFDKESLETLKIDLWTTEMKVIEMDRFMFQTLRSLADTYARATNNMELSNDLRRFVEYFGEKTEIIPKNQDS